MPCPQPDDPTPLASSSSTPDSAATICVRCKTNPAIAIFRDSIYCQTCALDVFYSKAKSGLEYARGAGLAKYVAAAKASSSLSASPATSATSIEEGKGRAKQINNGGGNAEVNVSANIAIGFSGGASSRALLKSAVQYFRPESSDASRSRKKGGRTQATESNTDGRSNTVGRTNEIGKIYVLYIDDSSLIPDGADRTEEARRMVEAEGCADLHFIALKIEDIYRSQGVEWKTPDGDAQHISSSVSSVADPKAAIKDLFASLHPSSTPRTGASSARTRIEDLHRILVSTLLRRTATSLSCAALLLGETATRISVRLIEDLAKGAGHKLPVQGSDAVWVDDLLLVRPLKTHLLQEILFYTTALGLEPLPEQKVVPSAMTTQEILDLQSSANPVMDKSSIANLTETFILNLEKGVPSTVTTIGKTGSKLHLHTSTATSASGGEVGSSISGFKQVGPTVALSSRKMSELNLGSKDSEPRIGSRGIKLAQTSASFFKWTTKDGCALCGMPSQIGARHWKRNITISSLAETAPSQEEEKEGGREGWIDLSDYLCYACLLVLAPPAVESEPQAKMLPAYVLEHIQSSTDKTAATDRKDSATTTLKGGDDAGATTQQNGHHGQCASHNPAPQPLARSEIKAQINEFLIDDA